MRKKQTNGNGEIKRRGRPPGSKNKPKQIIKEASDSRELGELKVSLKIDTSELDEIEARIDRLAARLSGAKRRGRPVAKVA